MRATPVGSSDTFSRLIKRARRAGVTIPQPLGRSLAAYLDLLFLWNRKINLTALTDPEEAVDRLLLEPVVAAKYLPTRTGVLIDIGSGGGSPAIPLKLVEPGLTVHMVESKTRKAAFLHEAVRHLALGSITIHTARFEELLTRPELHEAADVLTIRAVRVDHKALLGLQAFIKPGGAVLLFRGPRREGETNAAPPPLVWEATHPLNETLQSRLDVFKKLR
jgi:16S rRNA (guanine527-N7)-methyltransferase